MVLTFICTIFADCKHEKLKNATKKNLSKWDIRLRSFENSHVCLFFSECTKMTFNKRRLWQRYRHFYLRFKT